MRLLYCALLLALSAIPFQTWAACSFKSGGKSSLAIALPGTLNVARDTPVGGELWSSGWRYVPGAIITCKGDSYGTGSVTGVGQAVTGLGLTNVRNRPYVYATNVPGIGISVYFAEGSGVSDLHAAWFVQERPQQTAYPVGTYDWTKWGNSWLVRLVKTGEISAGAVTIAGTATAGFQGVDLSALILSGTAEIHARSCDVDRQEIAVLLPTAARADFAGGAGALADNSKARAFSIDLSCDPQVAVNYRIDGQQASGVPDVLANATGPGMATGVGVQLFKGDTSSTTVQSLGVKQTHVVTTGQQQVQIPLAAKYYRTAQSASAITPGQVTARATFTMSYE